MASYRTNGSCAREIIYKIQDNKLIEVKFIGGCNGNLRAISRLVTGKDIDSIIDTLKGINCKNDTSCPDQLAQALILYKENQK